MKEYGEIIEEIINISGQKYYLLAKKLGYDVSYISKWTKGTKLPSKKNIMEVNKNIVEFIAESVNEDQLNQIIDRYDIEDYDEEDIINSVKLHLEETLLEHYNYSLGVRKNKKTKINNSKDTLEPKENKGLIYNNSNMTLNPTLKKKLLDSVFKKKIENKEEIDIITMSNLFSLNDSDKIYTLKVTSNFANENKIKNIKYIINIDNKDENDVIYNTMLLINIATQHKNTKIDFYEYDFPSYTLVTVVKDIIIHSAIYNKSRQCFLTSSSLEEDIVREGYDTLEDIINNQSSKIFNKHSVEDIIKNKIYNKYILSNNIRILMGNIDELLMPENLFFEIGTQVFPNDKEIMNELEEINDTLKTITYKRKMKILIYEKSIVDYFLNREMIFFNRKVNLTTNQMKEHYNYFKKIILENENIEIGLIRNDFVEEFNHLKNPSLYLSKMSNLLRCSNENNEEFLVNNSTNLTELFNDFYEMIWENQKDKIIFHKETIFETIENDFEYII